jgi:dihydroneopterin triphosphate diphosphatase
MATVVCRIVEVCIFRFMNDRPEYLMLRRSPEEKIYPALWQFVSGAIDAGERAIDAALRELKEETGFVPTRFWVVPHANAFYDPSYDSVQVSPLFAAQVSHGDEPRLSKEHTEFEWLSYVSASERLVWPGQRLGLDVVNQYILGGEKAGILTEIPL